MNQVHLLDDEDNSWNEELSNSEGSLDEEYYGEEEEYGDESFTKAKTKGKKGKVKLPVVTIPKKSNKRISINVFCTEYEVVKKVAKKGNNFKLIELDEDNEGAIIKGQGGQKLSSQWDISWHDLAISPDFLSKMEPYQKVSQFPGIYVVCRKNHLARNLMKMQR